jgi:penicillin-binding protein 1A
MYNKDQILNLYLNESPYGGRRNGVESAAQTYFGKPAKSLTLSECALLAAIPQSPSVYDPYNTTGHKLLLERQRRVLNNMVEQKMITKKEGEDAKKVAVLDTIKPEADQFENMKAPHFVQYVRSQLEKQLGKATVGRGGLTVKTTLDMRVQDVVQSAVTDLFNSYLPTSANFDNGAATIVDNQTGQILALQGSRDYNYPGYGQDNAAVSFIQPGSSIKPFVYATAFMKGYTPETVLFDVKTEFSTQCTVEGKLKDENDKVNKCYSPENYDLLYEGPITIRKALARSRNIPAVKALYLAGIKDSIETAEAMGITSLKDPNRYGLTLVLGGGEVSLLELTSAYGVFANDGIRNPYRSILRIEDSKGNVLEEFKTNPTQAIPPQPARQISNILSDPKVMVDSIKPIVNNLNRQVAVKTGTTNDYRDVWIEGYTPNIVVGAWAGKNDNTPMDRKVAGLIITPVWGAFMSEINRSLEKETFKNPEPDSPDIKPVLRNIWKGGISYKIDLDLYRTKHFP